jgi:alkylation response protein AidB-like acyl-CoA dehydrogenase
MDVEHATMRRLLPELANRLVDRPLAELERRDSGAVQDFREASGPALLMPESMGGLGGTPLDAIRVQRAIGSLSPSLAAGTTMHHLSLATLLEFCLGAGGEGIELVEGLVRQRAILASGFSEGKTGHSVFQPTMRAVPDGNDYIIDGAKQPCSLSRSMDLLVATVAVHAPEGEARGIALVPAATPGLSRRPFWDTPALAGAESDAVVLEGVRLPADLVLLNHVDDPEGRHEMTGFLWFGLLISATYVGAASALCARLLAADKGDPEGYVRCACELESAMAALEAVARDMHDGQRGEGISARLMLVRCAVHGAVLRAATAAVESLGGMAFIRSPDVAYLASAVHGMGFHPPSRRTIAPSLYAYHAGDAFSLA